MSDDRFIMGRDDESYAIYVAKDPETKQYLKGVLRFLMSGEGWMKNATVDKVKEELVFVASHRPIWNSEINAADVWSRYSIEQCAKYLPNVAFVKITLGVENKQPDGWGQTSVSEALQE